MPSSQLAQSNKPMPQNLRFLFEAKLTPQKADEKKGLIKAIATSFGPRETKDGRKFYYTAEAFAQWADEYNNGMNEERPLPLLVNHVAEAMPIGQWDRVELTDEEMRIEGRIFTETTGGMDMMKLMEASPNMMGGVSIAPMARDWRMVDEDGNETDDTENGYFQITQGSMNEISIVTHPANKRAEITSIEKYLHNEINPRYVERLLREQGMSRKQAVNACGEIKRLMADMPRAKVENVASDSQKSFNELAILEALEERALLSRLTNRK